MHDALPDEPLRAMVPVSIRTGDEEDPWTNRVGGIIADLPTNCDDPLERLRRCHEAMNEAKRQMDVLPAEAIAELAQVAPPLAATAAMRLQSRLRLADRVNLPVNVVISNVPGPRHALYFAGARMTNYIPVSTIADDMGLNITVHSYLDRLDFGLIADRELVPDLWDLVDLHIDEIGRLFEATGAEWAEPQPAPVDAAGRPGLEDATGCSHEDAASARRRSRRRPRRRRSRRPRPSRRRSRRPRPRNCGQEVAGQEVSGKKSPVKKAPVKRAAARKIPVEKAAAARRRTRTPWWPEADRRRRPTRVTPWTSISRPRTIRPEPRSASGSPPIRARPAGSSPRRATSCRTGRGRGGSTPTRSTSSSSTTSCRGPASVDRTTASASGGRRRPSSWPAPPSNTQRYLPKIFSGEEFWCQLFSEPDAGSDLANLATRAVRDGDEYVVNGSKIWSSGAHHSKLGILIARTDPDQPKHKGISYFICPMDLPGITMSPIVDMTTAHSFNQVFFDDVRIPASLRVGDENDGWRLAKVTLSNERVSLSSAGSLWGVGPSAEDLLAADPGPWRTRRPGAARSSRAAPHRVGAAAPQPDAQPERDPEGEDARARGVDPEDHGRRARPARDGAGQGGRRRRRHARRIGPRRGDPVVARRTDRRRTTSRTPHSTTRSIRSGTTATSSARRSRSAAAPSRCSATSWRSSCSGSHASPTSKRASPGPRRGISAAERS